VTTDKVGIVIFTATLIVFIGITIYIGSFSLKTMQIQNGYIQCCGGQTCSDTYYTPQDNKCHLVLCENSIFTNKKDCVYEGANISITLT
jgi:hypothetical protein